jgi:hypothetical protein
MFNIKKLTNALSSMLLAATATFSTATSRAAAGDVRQEAGPLFNPVLRREIEAFAVKLSLDPEQRNSALALYKGYRDATQYLIEQTDKDMERASSKKEAQQHLGGDPKLVLGFLDSAEKLDESFFDDFKATLRAEQAAKFDSIIRAHRRAVGTRFAAMAGEGMDLIVMADRLKLRTADNTLSDALTEYENAIDPLMREKSDLFKKLFQTMANVLNSGNMPDEKVMQSMVSDMLKHSARVRDLNRSHARTISSLLSDSDRAAWDKEVLTESYPRIYKQSAFKASLAAALKDASLSAEQKAAVATIAERFELDATAINTRWAAAIDEKQAALMNKDFTAIMRFGESLKDDDALIVARKHRIECDRDAVAKLSAVLDESQRAKLPGESAFLKTSAEEDIFPMNENNASTFAEFDSDKDELAVEGR